MVAAISDPRMPLSSEKARGHTPASNVMFSLQHDTGKVCTEYTWSAEDGMWGVRSLYNFGRVGPHADASSSSSATAAGPAHTQDAGRRKVKRVDEEDAMVAQPFNLEPGLERRLATRLFNRVWELLERTGRSPHEDDEMVHAAHASRFHWGVVGEPVGGPGRSSGAIVGAAFQDEPQCPRMPSETRWRVRTPSGPSRELGEALATRRHRRTFHSSPPAFGSGRLMLRGSGKSDCCASS